MSSSLNKNNSPPENGSGEGQMLAAVQQKSPMESREVVELIASYLSSKDLMIVRLLNLFWFYSTIPAWNKKFKFTFTDITELKKILGKSANKTKLLPYTVHDWSFQRLTVKKLMTTEGRYEQELMTPFWSSIQTLRYENWNLTKVRYERYQPNPRHPWHWARRPVQYQVPIKGGSAYQVKQMLTKCTNLTTIIIDWPVLIRIRGAYIGPRQFPQLQKVLRFEIVFEGGRFNEALEAQNFEELIRTNIIQANTAAVEIPKTSGSQQKSGAETLVTRILDHSPNLKHFSVSRGTLISTKVESWITEILCIRKKKKVLTPSLASLMISIPLSGRICKLLQTNYFKLRSFHLRTLPTIDNADLPSDEIMNLLFYFNDFLEHLEIIYMGRGESSTRFTSKVAKGLKQLTSIELWGFTGSLAFLKDFEKLQTAIIGSIDNGDGSFERAREYFENNPIPNADIQVKPQADFVERINEGPKSPIVV